MLRPLVLLSTKASLSQGILTELLQATPLEDLEQVATDLVRARSKMSPDDLQLADANLEEWFCHPEARVRVAAIIGADTGSAADDYKSRILGRALRDADPQVRGMAAVLTLHLKSNVPPHFQEVAQQVAASEHSTAETLLDRVQTLLLDKPQDAHVKIVLAALDNPNNSVRRRACRITAMMAPRDPGALARIVTVLDDPNLSNSIRLDIEQELREAAA